MEERDVALSLLHDALDGNELDGYVLRDWKQRARIRAFLNLPGAIPEARAEIDDMLAGRPRVDRLGG